MKGTFLFHMSDKILKFAERGETMKNRKMLKIIIYPYFMLFLLTETTELFRNLAFSKYYGVAGGISIFQYFIVGCLMGDLADTAGLYAAKKAVAVAAGVSFVPIALFLLRTEVFSADFYAKYLTLLLFLFGFFAVVFLKILRQERQ